MDHSLSRYNEKLRILAIDDSPSVLLLYKELLGGANIQIDSADNGQQGLELATTTPYDLIITDIEMPIMDGIELCRRLKKDPKSASTPVIISSIFNSEQDIEHGFKAGAAAYLSKSEVRPLLTKTVSEVLWKSKQLNQKKILIVDDSNSILKFVEEGLLADGFLTRTASNGELALGQLKKEKPDLILSDINMPRMDGFELCKAVKNDPELALIPFIVMSTNDDRTHMSRMIQYGAAGYLVKPFNLQQLIVLIEQILSDHFKRLLKERERLAFERESLIGSISSLVSALEARDSYTRGHSEAVAQIASQLIALTGADQKDVEMVAIGGRLHDIGKIGIRDRVLLKPGKLSDKEMAHIRQHVLIGKTILEPIASLQPILPIIHSHHERWDGKGYPEGLQGEQIPLWARITAVADTYHALISDRPYRPGMPEEKALAILAEERGAQFCPECLDLFFVWHTRQSSKTRNKDNS